MALAFALGVMNPWWMAALTLILVVEKTAPRGDAWSRWLGWALVAWGERFSRARWGVAGDRRVT